MSVSKLLLSIHSLQASRIRMLPSFHHMTCDMSQDENHQPLGPLRSKWNVTNKNNTSTYLKHVNPQNVFGFLGALREQRAENHVPFTLRNGFFFKKIPHFPKEFVYKPSLFYLKTSRQDLYQNLCDRSELKHYGPKESRWLSKTSSYQLPIEQ